MDGAVDLLARAGRLDRRGCHLGACPAAGVTAATIGGHASCDQGGPSKLIGLVTITDQTGHDVPDPVFEFDGCFDPSA